MDLERVFHDRDARSFPHYWQKNTSISEVPAEPLLGFLAVESDCRLLAVADENRVWDWHRLRDKAGGCCRRRAPASWVVVRNGGDQK